MRECSFSVAVMAIVFGLGTSAALGSVSIPTVPVGNAGNAADPLTGGRYGSVSYTYNIGATEVTNAQYAAFLNAKAKADPHLLYNTNMLISRSGSNGSYIYEAAPGRANHPVTFVSYWDATRFANWLHNGQGSGDTETGAYTLTDDAIASNTVTRNAGWQWAVTSEDEWYKAAYFQPASQGGDSDNYWLYPTSSNAAPTAADVNFADSGIIDVRAVGSYTANVAGTFDMGGNVWEWNEAIISTVNRGARGGSFASSEFQLLDGSKFHRPARWIGSEPRLSCGCGPPPGLLRTAGHQWAWSTASQSLLIVSQTVAPPELVNQLG